MFSKAAIKGAVETILLFPPEGENVSDLETLIKYFLKKIQKYLLREKGKRPSTVGLKFIVKLKVILGKYNDELRREITVDPWFTSSASTILVHNDIAPAVRSCFQDILKNYDNYVHTGSGWTLKRVVAAEYTYAEFKILRGGCSLRKKPKELKNSRGILSLRGCSENDCFFYAVAACVHKVKKNPTRCANKFYQEIAEKLKWKEGPISLKDMPRFEKEFKFVSVNVYGFDQTAVPLYISHKKRKFHVNLFFYRNHFFPVRNLSALIKVNHLRARRKMFVCQFCLAHFRLKYNFSLHQQLCTEKRLPLIFPSEEHSQMSFTCLKNKIPAPFAIYCDLESIVLPEVEVNDKKLLTTREHKPIAAGALSVCCVDPKLSSAPFIYTGVDCIEKLFSFLVREVQRIDSVLLTTYYPIVMTKEDSRLFEEATKCKMCGFVFSQPSEKMRDHDHLTGKFRGVLCNCCNLSHAKTKFEVNIFFHGLSNYDSHFLVQEIHKLDVQNLHIIPKTGEKYLSFKLDNVIFKDSFQFLGASLSSLVTNLVSKGKSFFTNVNQFVQCEKRRALLFQKGIFPYSYFDDISKLNDTALPPKDAFKSDLTGEMISDRDYEFALHVWKTFECKNFQDYMEIYLLADVLLLADVFENFRRKSLQDYSLDPIHYFSTPHFTLDAFLSFSKVSLDLIMDINQFLFLKDGIRGGLSMCCQRYSKNNVPGTSFDSNISERYLYYFDANNLYGKAMMSPLPHSDFQWMTQDMLTVDFILSIPKYGFEGCIIECDFEYPSSLHDVHSDYPLAPHKVKIPYSKLSPYAKDICDKFHIKSSTGTEKLMATVLPKENYVLHYWNFQLYIELGLKVQKIHRGIYFSQEPFIKSYIEYNSNKRAEATNDFDVNFYKLLNNSLYGKTIENPEKRARVVLTSDKGKFQKLVGSPCYKESKIINDNLVGVTLGYPAIKIQKPFYIGMAILEFAKFHMYNFHYNVMKSSFGNRLKLLYTDTDSFLYEINAPMSMIEQVFSEKAELFDFSNYPKSHHLFSDVNKKVPGLFKDETAGTSIKEFVGLRSKMYSFVFEEGQKKNVKTAKGVKKKCG